MALSNGLLFPPSALADFPKIQSSPLPLPSEMRDKIPIGYRMFCSGFCAAAATEAKDLDQRLRQIEAARRLPRQLLVVDEITFYILHRLAARADQMVMRFEVAFHQQGGSTRTHFPQQSVFHKQPQIVINGC